MTPSVNTEPLYFFLKASLQIPVKGEERTKEKEREGWTCIWKKTTWCLQASLLAGGLVGTLEL